MTRSSPSRTCSMWVINTTWGKRSANRRSRPTTCWRRPSSSEPKISSSTSSVSGWPARSAIICEIARRGALRRATLHLADARLGRRQLAAGLGDGDLRVPQGPDGPVVAFPRRREPLLREPLRGQGGREVAGAALVHRQRLLRQLGLLDQDLRPLGPL